MSASSRPTLAPLRPRAQARLIATVDFPTPPFPEATAMTCLTPGRTWFGCRPLKAERTLAVIFKSTAVTPGRSATSLWAIVRKRSRTGQAGVVSSNVKLTFPSAPMTRSLIMPRLTTSRPRSGSWMAASTPRICSEVGGPVSPLLGTEDHRRPQGEHAKQHQQRYHERARPGSRGDRLSGTRPDTRLAPRGHQRRRDPDQREHPQREPCQRPARRPGSDDRDEECDQQDDLEHREIPIRLVEAAQRECRLRTVPGHERHECGRAAKTGGDEQASEHPRVAPDRLVADAEEHPGVGRDEQPQDAPDEV